MNNVMKYKGYIGSVNFDAGDKIFHGRIIGISDIITFEGLTVNEIETDFKESVDEYLQDCAELGKDPEKPFSGKFVLRTSPDLHAMLSIKAKSRDMSLNSFIVDLLERAVA